MKKIVLFLLFFVCKSFAQEHFTVYFDNNKLIKLYEETGNNVNDRYVPNPDEPEMLFHEFVFVLG